MNTPTHMLLGAAVFSRPVVPATLVAALMGETRIRAIYDHAIRTGYRFFSYGDSSLLIPETRP